MRSVGVGRFLTLERPERKDFGKCGRRIKKCLSVCALGNPAGHDHFLEGGEGREEGASLARAREHRTLTREKVRTVEFPPPQTADDDDTLSRSLEYADSDDLVRFSRRRTEEGRRRGNEPNANGACNLELTQKGRKLKITKLTSDVLRQVVKLAMVRLKIGWGDPDQF